MTLRAAGSPTSELIEAVRLVGPSEPATNRGRSGWARFGRVGGVAGQARRRDVDVADRLRVEAVVGLGDAGRGERVRAEDVRAGIEIGDVDGVDGRRLGQAQEVAVAAQVARMVAEPLAAEIGFGEPVGLEHRAHRPVEHEDPLAQEVGRSASRDVRSNGVMPAPRPGGAPGSGGRARRTARSARSSA